MLKYSVNMGFVGEDAHQPRTGTAATPEDQGKLAMGREKADVRAEGLSEAKEEKHTLAQLFSECGTPGKHTSLAWK